MMLFGCLFLLFFIVLETTHIFQEPEGGEAKGGSKKKVGLILKDTVTYKTKKTTEKITGIVEFSSFSVTSGPNNQINEALCELLRQAGLKEEELD